MVTTVEEFQEQYQLQPQNVVKCLNLWIIGRYAYSSNVEFIDDKIYDKFATLARAMTAQYREGNIDQKVAEQLCIAKVASMIDNPYEDDEYPAESFALMGVSQNMIAKINESRRRLNEGIDNQAAIAQNEKLREFQDRIISIDGKDYKYDELTDLIDDMVAEDPPKSINPLESVEEAYNWFSNVKGKELCISLKIDGVNIRAFYISGHLVYCCTRGRSGNVRDYTLPLTRKLPWYVVDEEGKPVTGIVRSECYADVNALQYLRDNYKGDYVVPRTAASTMLSVLHRESDYEHLKLTTFNARQGGKLNERIDWAKEQGFDTVPYILTSWNGESLAEFRIWVDELLSYMWRIGKMAEIKTDGIVVEINDSEVYESMIKDGMYNDGNIALKIGPWEPGVYEATLEDIVLRQQAASSQFSVVGKIKPVKISSGITITYVNLFNMGLVQSYGLRPGSTLTFLYKNDNAAQWLYGSELA